MKNRSVILLVCLFILMLFALPFAVPSGAVTPEANMRYTLTVPMDDEYAFLGE